jgi:hypothetical protein
MRKERPGLADGMMDNKGNPLNKMTKKQVSKEIYEKRGEKQTRSLKSMKTPSHAWMVV